MESECKKGSTMIFFHFLFVPSFHFRTRKKISHKFRSSYSFVFLSFFLSFCLFGRLISGLSHLHRFYFTKRCNKDKNAFKLIIICILIKKKFELVLLLFWNVFQGKIITYTHVCWFAEYAVFFEVATMIFQSSLLSLSHSLPLFCPPKRLETQARVWSEFSTFLSNYRDKWHINKMTVICGTTIYSHNTTQMMKLIVFEKLLATPHRAGLQLSVNLI